MVLDINTTGTLGLILVTGTQTLTGNMFGTLMVLYLIIMVLAFLFGIPIEFTAILILPLTLGCMAYYGEFLATGSCLIIYMAFIMTKNWPWK